MVFATKSKYLHLQDSLIAKPIKVRLLETLLYMYIKFLNDVKQKLSMIIVYQRYFSTLWRRIIFEIIETVDFAKIQNKCKRVWMSLSVGENRFPRFCWILAIEKFQCCVSFKFWKKVFFNFPHWTVT